MKINPTIIILDHLNTLRDSRTGKASAVDFTVFFALPGAIGGAAYYWKFNVRPEIYNASIAFFGIFIALLLNIQVAIFAILQRKREKSTDSKIEKIENDELLDRRILLGELNSNLSYLVLFCCFSLVLFLVFYATDETSGISSAISTILFSHFVLTLLMIVKRSHALFQKEYTKTNG